MSGFAANPANLLDAGSSYTVLFSEAEKLNFVLKKVLGVPNTRPGDTDSMFRELPRPSRFAVFNDQIYAQRIPDNSDASGGAALLTHEAFEWEEDTSFVAAAPVDDLRGDASLRARRFSSRRFPQVAHYVQLPLAPAFAGARQAFTHPLLVGQVPNTLADVYTPAVYDATGGGAISITDSPYIIDPDAGVLTFYDNARRSVDAAKTPRVTFYRYEGPRGAAGVDAGVWRLDASSRTVFCAAGVASVAIGKTVALPGASLDVSGDVVATTVRAERHVTLSDARLKEEVERLPPVLEAVRQLSGYRYKLQAGAAARAAGGGLGDMPASRREIGLLAQEVEPHFPELIFHTEGGYKMLMYDRMVAVLLEAVKEQQTAIEALQARVDRVC